MDGINKYGEGEVERLFAFARRWRRNRAETTDDERLTLSAYLVTCRRGALPSRRQIDAVREVELRVEQQRQARLERPTAGGEVLMFTGYMPTWGLPWDTLNLSDRVTIAAAKGGFAVNGFPVPESMATGAGAVVIPGAAMIRLCRGVDAVVFDATEDVISAQRYDETTGETGQMERFDWFGSVVD